MWQETDQRWRRESDNLTATATFAPRLHRCFISTEKKPLIFFSSQYCWRWTGFNFGFDLLVTYTNRFIVFKRNTLSQPCGGAVSLQPRRHLAYRRVLQATCVELRLYHGQSEMRYNLKISAELSGRRASSKTCYRTRHVVLLYCV